MTQVTVLEYFNFFFTVAFAAELFVKLGMMGPREYIKDDFNKFDGTIVAISFIEMAMEWPPNFMDPNAGDEITDDEVRAVLRVVWRSARAPPRVRAACAWRSVRACARARGAGARGVGSFPSAVKGASRW